MNGAGWSGRSVGAAKEGWGRGGGGEEEEEEVEEEEEEVEEHMR